ncbi:MAG: ABC transporter permease [Finegoldia magna]|uniref:ABC transporter permease n=1 Tax=Finegoldia magna TaxID=1260 RepID=UPI0029006CFB|nr:ABC transporter permease [Finegoldia magna]MDU3125263.1 ABC transporter permease [Finegoldia magna]MDU5215333.1 ABC transporter permease [Finegoldia magna]MDU5236456.1 ABC transporter permease [Finegoldia magna]
MIKYAIKRVLNVIPILFVVSIVVFMIIHLTPGNPATQILGMQASKEQIEEFNEKAGLNDPIIKQYGKWIKNAIKGDLGESYFMDESVGEAIGSHFRPTLSLAIFSEILSIIIGIWMGIASANKKFKTKDKFLSTLSLIALAIPTFVSSLILALIFSIKLRIFPVAGYEPLSSGLSTHLKFLILPGVALAIPNIAVIMRITRSSIINTLKKDYIKTQIMKGQNKRKIIAKHALKNSMLPIITLIGQSFGALITGAIVVESVFNIPGLGQLLINSIQRRDIQMIQGMVLTISVVYVMINLIVDLLYMVIDPRINLYEGDGNE